ncbi:MAG: hypothetical protein ABJH63_19765 [Rhizobiaceae bacterium]
MNRFKLISSVISVIATLMLSGCFVSERPLISAAEADYPFQSITYEFPGEDDRVTLVRTGESYTAPAEEGDGKLLLKQISDDTYVLQIEFLEGGKPSFLFALAKLAADKKSLVLIKPFAQEADLEVARRGDHGLKPCAADPDVICLTTLDGYVKYALDSDAAGHRSITVVELN